MEAVCASTATPTRIYRMDSNELIEVMVRKNHDQTSSKRHTIISSIIQAAYNHPKHHSSCLGHNLVLSIDTQRKKVELDLLQTTSFSIRLQAVMRCRAEQGPHLDNSLEKPLCQKRQSRRMITIHPPRRHKWNKYASHGGEKKVSYSSCLAMLADLAAPVRTTPRAER